MELDDPDFSHNVPSINLLKEQADSKGARASEVVERGFRKRERAMNSLSSSKLENRSCQSHGATSMLYDKDHSCAGKKLENILNYPSYSERSLSSSISKMVSKLIRHFDQEERQTDGAVHWDTIKPVLEKGFRSHGVESFSETQWIEHIYKGSNKVRFEYCDFSENINVHSCDSGTFRRNNNCFRINGTRITATRMERIHT